MTPVEFMRACKFEGPCCVLAALTVRDALRRLGERAEVRSVGLRVRAIGFDPPMTLHEVGVGLDDAFGQPYRGKDWPGHLVAVTPTMLIDPTFYRTRRQAWSWIPDVAIVPRATRSPPDAVRFDQIAMPVLAVMSAALPELENYRFEATWLGFSRNDDWRRAPDTWPARRRDLVAEIVAAYHQSVRR